MVSKEVRQALSQARKIEKHPISTQKELKEEDSLFKKMTAQLQSLLKPQWFLKHKKK